MFKLSPLKVTLVLHSDKVTKKPHGSDNSSTDFIVANFYSNQLNVNYKNTCIRDSQ